MNVARDYRLGDHLISSSLRAACEIPEGVHRAGSSELQAGAALFIDPAEPGVEELLSSARVAESHFAEPRPHHLNGRPTYQ